MSAGGTTVADQAATGQMLAQQAQAEQRNLRTLVVEQQSRVTELEIENQRLQGRLDRVWERVEEMAEGAPAQEATTEDRVRRAAMNTFFEQVGAIEQGLIAAQRGLDWLRGYGNLMTGVGGVDVKPGTED